MVRFDSSHPTLRRFYWSTRRLLVFESKGRAVNRAVTLSSMLPNALCVCVCVVCTRVYSKFFSVLSTQFGQLHFSGEIYFRFTIFTVIQFREQ